MIAVRLHERGKINYCLTNGLPVKRGDDVVVDGSQGLQYGVCCGDRCEISEAAIDEKDTLTILRPATPEDVADFQQNLVEEREAYRICQGEIARHDLPMKLVAASYTLDRSRLIFFFTADGRVDFRQLVKDLAAIFRVRIELRQIGVRDEACLCGGLGICGRELCCASFLSSFRPVSIKMAKEQNLSMNPAKISGACGRLLCCLCYEEAAYRDAHKRMPARGSWVDTPEGRGVVKEVNLLKETVSVRLDDDERSSDLLVFKAEDVKVLKKTPRK